MLPQTAFLHLHATLRLKKQEHTVRLSTFTLLRPLVSFTLVPCTPMACLLLYSTLQACLNPAWSEQVTIDQLAKSAIIGCIHLLRTSTSCILAFENSES